MRSKEKKKREEMKKQKEWPDWMRKGEKKRRGRTHLNKIRDNNFSTNLFESNPILDAGAKMFQELEAINWDTCANCREKYICVKLGPRNHECSRCAQNPFLFSDENDLSPSES